MARFKLFGAALMVSAAMASPVFAQGAVSAPANHDFFNPNGDLLHGGGGQAPPAFDAMALMPHGGGKIVRHHLPHRLAANRADRYSAQ